jgi:hypothetical protein
MVVHQPNKYVHLSNDGFEAVLYEHPHVLRALPLYIPQSTPVNNCLALYLPLALLKYIYSGTRD